MDPQATLAIITDEVNEIEDRREACSDLANWISSGGYAPGGLRYAINAPSFGGNTAARNWSVKALRDIAAGRRSL
tara:strand:+ start:21357 stop:21581 length:225 start_codon:yes stop_codon:yes gene_type:complete